MALPEGKAICRLSVKEAKRQEYFGKVVIGSCGDLLKDLSFREWFMNRSVC